MWFIPEHGLLVALIENAALDACIDETKKGDQTGEPFDPSPRRSAHNWLFDWGSADSALSFTFPWVCWNLDLDPDGVAKRLKRFVEQHKYSKHKRSNYLSFYNWLRNGDESISPTPNFFKR